MNQLSTAPKERHEESVVVRSLDELKLASQTHKGGIANLTLEGNFATCSDLKKYLPPSIHESIRNLSMPDSEISADKLADLKSFLKNLESITVGCTAEWPSELTRMLDDWHAQGEANSCKVMVTKVVARESCLSAAILDRLTHVTELDASVILGKDFKHVPSSLLKLTLGSGVPDAGLTHLTGLIELDVLSLDGPAPSSVRVLKVDYEVSAAQLVNSPYITDLDVLALTDAGPKPPPSLLRLNVRLGPVPAGWEHLTQPTKAVSAVSPSCSETELVPGKVRHDTVVVAEPTPEPRAVVVDPVRLRKYRDEGRIHLTLNGKDFIYEDVQTKTEAGRQRQLKSYPRHDPISKSGH